MVIPFRMGFWDLEIKRIWIGWGPGGNGKFDEAWFHHRDDLSVWMQPELPQNLPSAWSVYRDDAFRFLKKQLESAKNKGQTVQLYVHSFGLQILLAWLRAGNPVDFNQITVLASTLNPFSSYENLGKKHGMSQFKADAPTSSDFFAVVGALTQNPDLFKSYWSDTHSAQYARFEELQKTIPHLHFDTFISVISDLLSQAETHQFDGTQPLATPSNLPVRVVLGEHDPLVNLAEEKAMWSKYFPQHVFEQKPCGHFPHFELPIEQVFNDKSA